mgnify:CR=1 FL=1
MQVGDLVVKKGDKQTYGLVVNFNGTIYGVMWLDDSAGWYEPAELEVVCK